jgi:EpsI family protein
MRIARALIVVAMLASSTALTRATRDNSAHAPAIVTALPYTIGAWTGIDAPPFDEETERVLAADRYVNRTYAASGAPVGLYVAYYARQRPTVSIHSPLHCLPGTGWEPLDVSTLDIARPDGSMGRARRMIVRKNLDRAVVLYWYDVHGRMLANELASKAWLLHDSVRDGRSDAALVRIVVPIQASDTEAEREAVAFARALLPFASS